MPTYSRVSVKTSILTKLKEAIKTIAVADSIVLGKLETPAKTVIVAEIRRDGVISEAGRRHVDWAA
jgi:hypothetical protein